MDFKNIFPKIVASILGFVILSQLFGLALTVILTIFFIIFRPEAVSESLWIVYSWTMSLGILIVVIIGIYLGLKSYKNKNIWYIVFKPTKNKAFTSIILSAFVVILSIISSNGNAFVNSYTFKPMSIFMAIPLTIISYFIFFYPFSALCNFIYEYKKDKLFKNSKVAIVLLLILLNPVFIVLSGTMGAVYRYGIMNEPCGLKVLSFNKQSPVKDSGMQVNEIIIQINNVEIKSLQDLNNYMNNYKPSMGLNIKTNTNTYSVNPVYKDGRYFLGVTLAQEVCERSLRK